MRLSKKIASILLSLLLLTSAFVITALPASALTFSEYGDYTLVKEIDADIPSYSIYKYNGTDTELVLPETVRFGTVGPDCPVIGIYSSAFYDDTDLVSVTIPDSYTSIGSMCFRGCSSLTSVNIPSSLTFLDTYAFCNCTSLTYVDMSPAKSLNLLYSDMFYGCTGLTGVKLPPNITRINTEVFKGCTALTDITIPDGVTSIMKNAFNGCTSLRNVVLPPNLSVINDSVFYDCSSLSSVDLPTTLTSIGASAFYNCTALTEVFIPDSVTTIGANCFWPMHYGNTFTAVTYVDSYAAQYCYENIFTNHTSVTKLMGDANLDGTFDVSDVTLIQKYRAKCGDIPTYRAKELADTDRDGEISVRDATRAQMRLANIITEL